MNTVEITLTNALIVLMDTTLQNLVIVVTKTLKISALIVHKMLNFAAGVKMSLYKLISALAVILELKTACLANLALMNVMPV